MNWQVVLEGGKVLLSWFFDMTMKLVLGVLLSTGVMVFGVMAIVGAVNNAPPPDIQVVSIPEETFVVKSRIIIDDTGLARYLVESTEDDSNRYVISGRHFKEGEKVNLVEVSIDNGLVTDSFSAIVLK